MSWYKGDTLLTDEGRYVIVDQDEEQIFTLAIEDVLPEDEAEYRCVAVNEAGKSESVAKLSVTDKNYPPEFTNEGQDEPYIVKKGEDLKLSVALKGKPFPDVQWYKDDKPLRSNLHYEISEQEHERSLCIREMTLDDRGIYKCEATSKLGKVTRKFQVNIKGNFYYRCLICMCLSVMGVEFSVCHKLILISPPLSMRRVLPNLPYLLIIQGPCCSKAV